MKAWQVRDVKMLSDYSVIVFAETRGQAISQALGTDEYPRSDWSYTELRALRRPELDGSYRGYKHMDWDNSADRLALVKIAGFRCDDEDFDPDECKRCVADQFCEKYAEYLDDCEKG